MLKTIYIYIPLLVSKGVDFTTGKGQKPNGSQVVAAAGDSGYPGPGLEESWRDAPGFLPRSPSNWCPVPVSFLVGRVPLCSPKIDYRQKSGTN